MLGKEAQQHWSKDFGAKWKKKTMIHVGYGLEQRVLKAMVI